MKRTLFFILLTAWSLGYGSASAQVNLNFDFDLYPDYYNHYDDDIYRYGFNINHYAASFSDRFVQQIHREYGISRSVVRRYLRLGFSPGDILFGAELSHRAGLRFRHVMDGYYNSPSRNWITIAVNLGIPYGSPRFNLILSSFNRYYMDWGHYYRVHRPNRRPPMYRSDWSYFRPSPTPHRVPSYNRPDRRPDQRPAAPATPNRRPDQRPDQPNQRPDRPNQRPAAPATPNRRPDQRPDQPNQRPDRPNQRPAAPATPNRRPETSNGNGTAGGSSDSYRRQPAVAPADNGKRDSSPNARADGNKDRRTSRTENRNTGSGADSRRPASEGNRSSVTTSRRSTSSNSKDDAREKRNDRRESGKGKSDRSPRR